MLLKKEKEKNVSISTRKDYTESRDTSIKNLLSDVRAHGSVIANPTSGVGDGMVEECEGGGGGEDSGKDP